MKTYYQRFKEAEERIVAEYPANDMLGFAAQSGAFRGNAEYYAKVADMEASRNAIETPERGAELLSRPDITPGQFANALYSIANALMSNNAFDWADTIQQLECTADTALREHREHERALQDALDNLESVR